MKDPLSFQVHDQVSALPDITLLLTSNIPGPKAPMRPWNTY